MLYKLKRMVDTRETDKVQESKLNQVNDDTQTRQEGRSSENSGNNNINNKN